MLFYYKQISPLIFSAKNGSLNKPLPSINRLTEGNRDLILLKSAAVFITGGFRKADVVVGPATEVPKIVPKHKEFTGPGEVLGVGTIYCDDEGPKMHMHTAIGKGDEVVTCCPRGGAKVFLVLEVTIIEILGVDGKRVLDEGSGFKLLRFS